VDNRILPIPDPRLQQAASVWLSVEQIRKQQRMRRERVIEAMESGELPYERRGRIRYARLSDVVAWEERRLRNQTIKTVNTRTIRSEFSDLL
jgi:hypothetical protein